MRTMFISLVLIWSLAQPAWAAEEILASALGCGGEQFDWDCFAPAKCIVGSTITPAENKVKRVENDKKLFADCDALFRFHQYDARQIYASLIGFQSLDKTNFITITQSDLNSQNVQTVRNKLSCTIEDGKRKGEYYYWTQDTEKTILKEGKASNPSVFPFECEFVVRKRDNAFFGGKGPFVVIETNNGKTIDTHRAFHDLRDNVKCNPSNLEFDNAAIEIDKKFIPVEYFPNKHGCENPEIYTLEYRDAAGNYKELSKDGLLCNGNTYQVNGVDLPLGGDVEIRCSADVRYFCDYKVMVKDGQEYPKQTLPDLKEKRFAELTCPDHPHLIIVKGGSENPILNFGKFTCVNYGTQQLWTVFNERKNRTIKITKEGPVVYCSKTVKCSLFFTLPESAVHNGFVNDKFLPECHDTTGTLKIGTKKVTKPRCDEATGKFMYIVEGEDKEQVMDKDTKFVCDYPPEGVAETEKKNEENRRLLTNGIIAAIAIGIGSAALGIGGFSWYQIRKRKAYKKKKESEIYAEQLAWGSRSMKEAARKATGKGKDTKGKDKKKGSKSSTKTESATDNTDKMDAMVVSAQNALAAALKLNANGQMEASLDKTFSKLPEKAPTAPSLVRINKKCALATGKNKDPNVKVEQKKREDMTPFEIVHADSVRLYGDGVKAALVERDTKLHPERHQQKKKK